MRAIHRVLNLRRGELGLTALLSLLYYLVLCTHYFLKPSRDALFLARNGPAELPLVFILSALVSLPITSFYGRASRALPLDRMILGTFAFLAANLVGLRFLIEASGGWVYYTFYIWVGIFGAITTSQFWLLSNALFDATQAKRVFAILGTGGILGAVTGGELTGVLVGRVGLATEDLLWLSIAVLFGCMGLVVWIWRATAPRRQAEAVRSRPRQTSERDAGKGTLEVLRAVRRSTHLSLTLGILAVAVVVGTLIDYQFKSVSSQAFSDADSLTSFLGTFYSRVSLVSLAVQLLVAGRLLGSLGAVGGLLALPLTLAVGAGAMILHPVLAAAVALRGGEMTLKYSMDKTARELLFLPVPMAIKRDVKIWFDLFVDRWFRGLAGVFLLVLTLGFGASTRGVAIATAVLIAVWIVLVVRLRPAYAEAFRQAIIRREDDVVGALPKSADPAVLASLINSLRSSNPGEVLYALRLIEDAPGIGVNEQLVTLVSHGSPAVRREAVRLLAKRNIRSARDVAASLSQDPDPDVRREAMWVLLRAHPDGLRTGLDEVLQSGDAIAITAALQALVHSGDDSDLSMLDDTRLEALADERGAPEVRHATMRLIARRRLPAYVPWLLSRLSVRDDRAVARDVLAAYGPEVLEPLVDQLRASATKPAARRAIPRIISGICDPGAVRVLLDELREGDRDIHPQLVNALYHLHRAFPHLAIPRAAVLEVMEDEARTWFAVSQARATLTAARESGGTAGADGTLLLRALDEKRQQAFLHLFRMLALLYPADDMRRAREGALSPSGVERANAREYLDQTLRLPERRYVLPTIGEEAEAFDVGDELFGLELRTPEHALRYFITGPDVWLACCALPVTRTYPDDRLTALVQDAQYGDYPLMRETARLTLGRRIV